MSGLKYLPNYTIDDYNQWGAEWELIDGIPFSLIPSQTRRHQLISGTLTSQIGNALKAQKETCDDYYVVYSLDWIVNNSTVVRPDISVNRKSPGDFITSAPVLIIEIMSTSTALKDRHVKFDLYQQHGVKYYIIADPNTRLHQIYLLKDGQYEEQANLTSFLVHDKCVIELNIEESMAELKD